MQRLIHFVLCRMSSRYREMHDGCVREVEDLKHRLAVAIEAQQKSTEQLIAERELRRSAEDRADQYHREAMDALKAQTDWLARGLYHRRPVYGVGAPPDEPERESVPTPINTKQSARALGNKITHETLAAMLKQVREGSRGEDEQFQFAGSVGPEFSTNVG